MLRKTERYIALAAGCMLICSACSSNDAASVADPEPQVKTPIELTVGIMGENPASISRAATRGVVTTDNPYGKQADAFSNTNTNLYMVMKSDDIGTTPSAAKYTRTMGVPAAKVGENKYNAVNFTGSYIRYWEDGHSRNSALSIYAACVPGQTTALSINSSTSYNSNTWSETEITPTITWPLSGTATTQTTEFLANQDLCFSNNISNLESTENRIRFNTTTNKFTTDLASGTNPERGGKMIFYHALTQVTFKIIKGTGFGDGENEFKFSDANKNIELVGFNTGGTFNIASGMFTSTTTAEIEKFANTKEEGDNTHAYVLTAFLVPGTDLNGADKDNLNKINFTIDHNQYHVTKGQLKEALSTKTLTNGSAALDNNKMRPGVHYIFTLTVGKKKMDKLTASVVPWEEVTADDTDPTNARIQVSLLKNGTQQTGAATFDLYRATYTHTGIDDNYADFTNWNSGYAQTENKAWLTENSTNKGIYTAHDNSNEHTPWYWPNNKTFYHFRTVMPKNHTVTENSTYGDYITLEGKAYSSTPAESYKDVCWGAPFRAKSTDQTKPDNTDEKLTYSTGTGFDNTKSPETAEANHQISKAIGATESTINIEMFHMMSDVTIKLTTSTGTDAVTIASATITLSNIYNNGLVRMGNGKVETTGSVADPAISGTVADVSGTYQWRYGFVPQSLASVVLTIQTTDHNLYIVDMKDVVATTVGNNLIKNPYTPIAAGNTNAGKYPIDYWYPNYKYTYTFKLTKSDISLITATLADWETVTAGDDNVQIK